VSTLKVQPTVRGVRVSFRVQPRASTTGVVGIHGDAIRVRLSAPPVDGAANQALIELLRKALGIPAGAITIVSGLSSRTKVVELEGVTEDRVRQLVQP